MRKHSCVSVLLVVKDRGESPVEEFGHLLGRPGLSSDEGLANDKHHLGRLLGEREREQRERKGRGEQDWKEKWEEGGAGEREGQERGREEEKKRGKRGRKRRKEGMDISLV